MTRFTWRHQYDDDADILHGAAAALRCLDESLTQQSFAEDADINVLVARFGISDGAIPPAVADPRFYGDFSDVASFREALDLSRDAVDRFNQLPAKLRDRFGHDPMRLFEFVHDPENIEEAVTLGLLRREERAAEPPPVAPAPQKAPEGA